MRTLTMLLVIGFVVSLAAAPAEAQRQPTRPAPPPPRPVHIRSIPDAGTIAVGGSISPTQTSSDFLGNGLGIAGNVEGYVTPRLSVRGQVGTAWWDITGLSYTGTLQPVFLLGNVVYNWEGADWHPYVTGGAGMYRYGFTEAGVTGSNTKGGYNFGGGVEYFFTPDATITGELLAHRVSNVQTNRAALGFKGSFWSFTVGAKKYF